MSELVERIKAAYEKDQKNTTKATRATDIPLSYESITSEWLTDVLCKNHPDAEVISHRLGEPDQGTSNRRRIFISYNAEGNAANLPASVFCKATHDLANRITLGTSGALLSETTFYNKIRPRINIEAPHSYFATYDPGSYNSIIILNDLNTENVEFCTQVTEITRNLAESQMALLANFHGQYHQGGARRNCIPDLGTWIEFFRKVESHDLEACCAQGVLDAEEVIPPSLFNRKEKIWSATLRSVEQHRHLPHTLNHGDTHIKNWYITRDRTMGLGDWQAACVGHWSRDVAYAISTALTVDDRRNWEKDLLQFYLDKLEQSGGPPVSFDDAWKYYRQQLFSALAWWTVTLAPSGTYPDMQPHETTIEFIKRMAHAIDDLDALASFD